MRLIPAIDLRHGRVVRLEQGDDARRTTYDTDPRAVLETYAAAGVELAHVVDLDGAFGETPQRALIAELAAVGQPQIEVGGGLRDEDAVAWALDAGCARVILGSMVAREPARFAALARRYPGQIVPALEVAGDELRVAGWREGVAASAVALGRGLRELPCPVVLVTDVERDGTLTGPNLELARRLARACRIPALLSGGVRSLADLAAARAVPEIAGAIVGKALYEGRFTLEEALAVCRGDDG